MPAPLATPLPSTPPTPPSDKPALPVMKEVVARAYLHTGAGVAPHRPGSTVRLAEADAEHLVSCGLASWPKEPEIDPAQARSAGPSVITGNAATAKEPGAA